MGLFYLIGWLFIIRNLIIMFELLILEIMELRRFERVRKFLERYGIWVFF